MFQGFESFEVRRGDVRLACRISGGGQGEPLLLLHGHPQSQAMWNRVAPALAQRFTVVMMDLRGYGDSSRPAPGEGSVAYSKREMAQDALAVMRSRGFERFQVLAHDRGARVAHRLAADHPQAVERLLLLDIAPTLGMYANTSEAFARAYWHWFFLVQPPPLPEALIDADPVRYVRGVMGARHAGLAAFAPEALAEYERCARIPGLSTGICGDYRASAGIDLAHDREDMAADLVLPVVGQHLAVLLAVVPAGKAEVVELQVDVEAAGGRLHRADALGHDFLADAVAGDDGDALLAHGVLLKNARASASTSWGASSAR